MPLQRVKRGGGWLDSPHNMRSADRSYDGPDRIDTEFGFRVARTHPADL